MVLFIEPISTKHAHEAPHNIEKNFPRVTLPARVNLSQCLFEKQLTPFAQAEKNSSRACSDSLALTELIMTRLGKPSVYLEKSWLS